ncbi:MAG: hypothetical protein ACYCX4_00510 [Bacillota bacterium]
MKMNTENSNETELLTHRELLELLESNRTRVRTACNTVLGISGVFLSVIFLTLFFALKDKPELLMGKFPWIILLSTLLLFVSLFQNIAGTWLPKEKAVLTKLILIDEMTTRVRNESRKLRLAIVFLSLSILIFGFALGLAVFDMTSGRMHLEPQIIENCYKPHQNVL